MFTFLNQNIIFKIPNFIEIKLKNVNFLECLSIYLNQKKYLKLLTLTNTMLDIHVCHAKILRKQKGFVYL